MKAMLFVFLGGGLGSILRFGTYKLARLWLPADFPWGTLIVNAVGGLAAGMLTGWLLSRDSGASDGATLFLMTGLLGGFTTFSAFSVDAVLLWQRGEPLAAGIYVLGSLSLAILGVLAGLALVRNVWA